MKDLSRFILIAAAVLTLSAWANGQNIIFGEKRKLISELLAVTRVEEDSLKIADTMMGMSDLLYPEAVKSSLEKAEWLSAQEKEQMEKTMVERHLAINKKIRERYAQAIDIKQFIADVYYPLYDKFYSENELKDLIAFYSSPTGRKVTENNTAFFAEAVKLTGEKLTSKIIKLVEEVVKEEMDGLTPPRPPEKKKN